MEDWGDKLEEIIVKIKIIREKMGDIMDKFKAEIVGNIRDDFDFLFDNQTDFDFESIDQVESIVEKGKIRDVVKEAPEQQETVIIPDKPNYILPHYIVELIKQKRKVKRKFQKSRKPGDKTELNRLTSKVKFEIEQWKLQHQLESSNE